MHGHSHEFRTAESRRVTLVGALVNLVLAILKTVVGFVGHSQSLIADGIHSFSDLATDLMVWVAVKRAGEEPDEEHPYGHGRFETAATLVLGILLIGVAALLIWDAAHRLFEPETLLVPEKIALVAAAISILANEGLFWYTIKVANHINSGLLRANAWHHRSDAISSIVVLIGVAGALAGLPYLDGIAAILVGLMIIKVGWDLGRGALQELVDTGLEPELVKEIRDAINAVDGVRSVHMLRTRRHGHQASADVHVQVDPWISVSEGHMISVAVEMAAKRSVDELSDVTVHIDPEDDEEISAGGAMLPSRTEALAQLEDVWKTTGCNGKWMKIQLHYVQGKIHVDAFLPLSCIDEEHGVDEITQRFSTPVESLPEFERVFVYFVSKKDMGSA